MPIIAESPPLTFGGEFPSQIGAPEELPTEETERTPSPAKTKKPTGTEAFIEKHKAFIGKLDTLPACFTVKDIPEFTSSEIKDHIAVAVIDKFVVETKGSYCTMQGVTNLKNALKRIGDL